MTPNAKRLRKARELASARGLCRVCRCRFPRPGLKICDDCHARTRDSAALYVAQGLCACGRKSENGKLRCKSCRLSQQASKKRRRVIVAGIICDKCFRNFPKLGNKSCDVCIAKISAYGLIRRARNQKAGRCACGRKRRRGSRECFACPLRRSINRIRREAA